MLNKYLSYIISVCIKRKVDNVKRKFEKMD